MEQTEVKKPKKKAPAKAKGNGAKKTAAKRKPEPVPVDPLVVGIADMPSVPALRHALVSWGTGQGHQADLDVALLARELCEKHCHFCGSESSTTLHLGTPWDKVELCKCLERVSLGVTEYSGMMQAFGQDARLTLASASPLTPAAQGNSVMNDFKRKYGSIRLQPDPYQEFLPNWRERIPEIMALARAHRIAPSEVIYANRCSCGNDFSVTAKMIVRSVNRHGSHMEMTKCLDCAMLRRETLEAASAVAGTDEQPATVQQPDTITRPKNKKRGKNRHLPRLADQESRLVASTGDGDLATMGDVLGPALEHLRQEAS